MTVNRACLLLRGLPFKSNKNDIFVWLYTKGLDCQKMENIELCKTRNCFNGRAIIECNSAEDAVNAAKGIHLEKFWHRYIECYPCVDVDSQFVVHTHFDNRRENTTLDKNTGEIVQKVRGLTGDL